MSDVLRPEDTSDRGALATGQMSRQGFLLRAAAGGVLIASSPQLDRPSRAAPRPPAAAC